MHNPSKNQKTLENTCFNSDELTGALAPDSLTFDKSAGLKIPHDFVLCRDAKNNVTAMFGENKWDFNFEACLPYVDIFMPNEQELLALTKQETLDTAIQHIEKSANIIVVKMGEKGSIAIQNKKRTTTEAFHNPTYVDSIGAGDSFNSGFIKKFIEKAPLTECLRAGNLMGALNTTAAGGTAAFVNQNIIKEKVKTIFNSEL